MPRIRFSNSAIQKLKPETKERTFWDITLPGFGVRVNPGGRKTWIAMYRVKGGKEVMQSLGTVALLDDVEQARELARAAMRLAREGKHPVAEARAAEQAKAAEEAERQFTFARLAERYLDEYCYRNTRASTAAETKRLLNRAIKSFGDRAAADITQADITALITPQKPAKRGAFHAGLVEGNSLLAAVGACYRWACRNASVPVERDPTSGVMKPLAKTSTRDRVLSDQEIIHFWRACDEVVGWPFGPLFQLLLLTAQRRGEVAGLRRSEINLETASWTLPAERAKNGRAHVIHLSGLALEIIQGLPQINNSDYLFTLEGDRPVVGFAYAKERIVLPSSERWTLHDLRRTACTGFARLGTPPHIADKILNHQTGTLNTLPWFITDMPIWMIAVRRWRAG